jgi:cyanate permease
MAAFPAVGALVQSRGWRYAWFGVGVMILAGLVPLAILVVRRNPESVGLLPDGDTEADRLRSSAPDDAPLTGSSLQSALRTLTFWVFAIGAALYGLVASGIGLFNEAILAERGFGPGVYYQTLVITAMTSLVGNFAGGWLARTVNLHRLMALSLFVLAAGLVALPHLTSMPMVMGWAALMGLGGGLVMVLFFSAWPRLYGRRELGRIQGVAQALTVLASAIGPLLLAGCVEWTGSYSVAFYALATAVAAVAVTAIARDPLRTSTVDVD